MKKSSKTVKSTTPRKPHSLEYRAEAVALADRIGVPAAAKELGVSGPLLYSWRDKARLKESANDAMQRLLEENVRQKRQLAEQAEELAILKKAAAYFAKGMK